MTLAKFAQLMYDSKVPIRVHRKCWGDDTYVTLKKVFPKIYDLVQKNDRFGTEERFNCTLSVMFADDWEIYEGPKEEEANIRAYIMNEDEGFYKGAIVISTPTYDCAKDCIDHVLDLSEEYALGIEESNIDLKDIMPSCRVWRGDE